MKPPVNLIVFVAEGMPAGAIGALGHPAARTPHLDRLASRSAVFTRAYCAQPVCTPGRAALFTGQYPHAMGCPDNEHLLPPGAACFPELAGFTAGRCAMIGKWDLGDEPRPQHGFTHWRSIDASRHNHYSPLYGRSAPTDYERFLADRGYRPDVPPGRRGNSPHSWFSPPPPIPEKYSPDAYAAAEASAFIEGCAGRPFTLWLPFLRCKPGPFDEADRIHDPATVPLPDNFDALPGPDWHLKERLAAFMNAGTEPDQWRRLVAAALDKVALIDRYVGRVLATVAARGLTENTVVAFTGDHGNHLGEHRLSGKCLLTEESVRVPLLLHIPGVTGRRRDIGEPVSHLDLVPTLLEALGRPVPAGLPGKSRLDFLAGRAAAPGNDVFIEWHGPSGKGDFLRLCRRVTEEIGPRWRGPSLAEIAAAWAEPRRTVITRDLWKYTHSPQRGEHTLFRLEADPGETRNLIADPRCAARLAELRGRLADWQAQTGDNTAAAGPGRYEHGFLAPGDTRPE